MPFVDDAQPRVVRRHKIELAVTRVVYEHDPAARPQRRHERGEVSRAILQKMIDLRERDQIC